LQLEGPDSFITLRSSISQFVRGRRASSTLCLERIYFENDSIIQDKDVS
jgi:hypothetical protein